MTTIENKSAPQVPNGALSTLSALFDDRTEAESAVKRLKDIGLPEDCIRFMPGYEADTDNRQREPGGWWGGLSDWLFPDEDRAFYAEGLRRGGYLVSVQVDDATYESAHEILDDDGSIDMDERADLWRNEGWDINERGHAALGGSVPTTATDPQTLDVAVNAARKSRELEKSTPRVRSYRRDPLMDADKPAPGLDEIAPRSESVPKA